jgi:hypothetical protein
MDDSDEDQRFEHHLIPPLFVEIDDLMELTGVIVYKVS